MESQSEQELVEKIKSRDGESLAKYIDLNRDRLCGFLRSITGEHLLAVVEIDVLMQEISTAALTGLPTAPLEQYEPIQWLQQLARRRVVDAHRFHFGAQKRDAGREKSIHQSSPANQSKAGLEQMLAASMTSPSAAFSRDVRMERLQAAVQELSEDQQTAIRMRYAEGLSTKEIAERLGKTDVATRVLLSRSMRQLEKILDDVRPTR